MTVIGIPTIVRRYSSPASNVNLKTDFLHSGLPFTFLALFDSGVTTSGTGGNPAVRTGTGWSPGALIIIGQDGTVQGQTGPNGSAGATGTGGAGGAGGNGFQSGVSGSPGGPATPGTNGSNGGIALLVERMIILRNASGTINGGPAGTGGAGASGGGGGGGGGAGFDDPKGVGVLHGGRGGDGNDNGGYNSLWSGPPAGSGGTGNGAGTGGSSGGGGQGGGKGAGGTGGGFGGSAGPGAAARPNGVQGAAINGNSLITYSGPPGTINGPVT